MTRLALVPLDERPVCTTLPTAVGKVAGVPTVLPPLECMPHRRQAGDVDALGRWVRHVDAAALIVSLEGLGFGALIPSRTGHETATQIIDRWSVLQGLPAPVHASVVVPRTADIDDAYEEPGYWARHGRAIHALSAALHTGEDVAQARARVPPGVRADWLGRRLRQHILMLAALGLVHNHTLTSLLVGIDDAAPASLSATDQRAAMIWSGRLELTDRVFVQPGADESAAVLVARALVHLVEVGPPRIAVACAAADGLSRIAPYETGPVIDTVQRQVQAAGAIVVDHDPDAVLVVHAPDFAGDWAFARPRPTDPGVAAAAADLVAKYQADGVVVGVADVGQPNGADPELVAALAERATFTELGAYAAWNTAGNTTGSAAAHLVAGVIGRRTGRFDAEAHQQLLARRLVEDWAWMSVIRGQTRDALGSDPMSHDVLADDDRVLARIGPALTRHLRSIPGFDQWHVLDGSVRFPWQRSFEIDLELRRSPGNVS